jgi:hypothetical protein
MSIRQNDDLEAPFSSPCRRAAPNPVTAVEHES